MTSPQVPALPEELDKLMRRMRLPCIRKAAPDVPGAARVIQGRQIPLGTLDTWSSADMPH